MEYELRVIHGNNKSFYGKARVSEENGVKTLISYQTDVAYIKDGKAVVNGRYSNTTARHIREFLKQNGFNTDMSFAKLEKLYSVGNNEVEKQEDSMLKTTKLVACLGDVFCNTQKENNDWKARMLKAGLENRGLIMPEDWDSLTEDEKEVRLNKVMSCLG